MAIKIGDAVLDFLVDTTQLDQAIARINAEFPSKLAPASAATGLIGTQFDSVAKSAGSAASQASVAGEKIAVAGKTGATAIKGTDEATQQLIARIKALEVESQNLQSQIASLSAKLKTAGTDMESAGHRGASSFHEAQGEAALLGEVTGVRLPRHVRSFLASLPGVSAALSAAFSITAVLFLIEAVISLGEKVAAYAESQKEIADAWDAVQIAGTTALSKLDDKVIESQQKIDELSHNYLAALKDQLTLIDHASLRELGVQFDDLAKQAGGAFEKMESYSVWDFLIKGIIPSDTKNAHAELEKFTKQFDELLRAGNEQGAGQRLGAEIDKIKDKLEALAEVKRKTDADDQDSINREIESYGKVFGILQQMSLVFDKVAADQKNQAQAAKDSALEKVLSDQAAAAQRNLDARLAGIQQEKIAQQLAFTEGKIGADQWAQAQIKAANDAAAAQIRYKDQLADIARRGVDGSKALAAAQDAATEKIKQQNILVAAAAQAIQRAKDEAAKLRAEWEGQVLGTEKIEDATRALESLTRAEEKLRAAEAVLAEAQISKDYSQQEDAINRLANFGVITEEKKAERLRELYALEERDAISALNHLLAEERANLTSAQTKFTAAAGDALFSEAELANLKRKLDEAQAAYDVTQARILKTQEQFEAKRLGLASTAGNQEIALQLKLKQHELEETQALIKQVEARKENTDALEAHAKSLTNLITLLQKEAQVANTVDLRLGALFRTIQRGDALTRLFERDLNSNSKGMQIYGQIAQAVSSEFSSAWESAIAGAILGQESFGQALAAATAQVLAQVAAQALIYGIYYTAQGIADAFWNPPRAGADFAAAGEFFAVAAVAGTVAHAINPGGTSFQGNGPSSNVDIGSAGQTQQQPIQTQNVQHFGSGAVVTKRMLAVVGDDPAGGDQEEAIIPLGSEEAKKRLSGAFLAAIVASQPGVTAVQRQRIIARAPALAEEVSNPQLFTAGTRRVAAEALQINRESASAHGSSSEAQHVTIHETHSHEHNWTIEGMISPDTFKQIVPKLAQEFNRQVSSGKTRLKASTSYRVTKRG